MRRSQNIRQQSTPIWLWKVWSVMHLTFYLNLWQLLPHHDFFSKLQHHQSSSFVFGVCTSLSHQKRTNWQKHMILEKLTRRWDSQWSCSDNNVYCYTPLLRALHGFLINLGTCWLPTGLLDTELSKVAPLPAENHHLDSVYDNFELAVGVNEQQCEPQ